MLANTPQLILSICYMVYNGLYTRMLAEFEWASFSTSYQPLRVTNKKGQQRSTYRLQLPYRWSVPLLVVSLLLHWLYSNVLYVSLYEGGFLMAALSSSPCNNVLMIGSQVTRGAGPMVRTREWKDCSIRRFPFSSLSSQPL